MKLSDFEKSSHWVMPWHKDDKAVQVKTVMFADGSEVSVKALKNENIEDFPGGDPDLVACQSKPVSLPVSSVPMFRRAANYRIGSVGHDPESFTSVEHIPLWRRTYDALDNLCWHAKVLCDEAVRLRNKHKYKDYLSVNFRKIKPDEDERNLWCSPCPKCGVRLMLRESNRSLDPKDRNDTNLTLWIEGRETYSHTHPMTLADAHKEAIELLLDHLTKCDGSSKIDLEGYWSSESLTKFSDRFEAWRNIGSDVLVAKCINCDEIFRTKDSHGVSKAREWQSKHFCNK